MAERIAKLKFYNLAHTAIRQCTRYVSLNQRGSLRGLKEKPPGIVQDCTYAFQ